MATREEMFVRYSDSVETLQAGEAETVDQITATLLNIAKKVGERQRHTVPGVHAKSHGLLKAEVMVPPDLREELRQGLFANAGSYGAVMRFSTNPGDILSDHISTPRGLVVKVIGVEGEMLPNHTGQVTQDFVFNNVSTFHSARANDFLKSITLLDRHADDSEALKQVVSSVGQTKASARGAAPTATPLPAKIWTPAYSQAHADPAQGFGPIQHSASPGAGRYRCRV
jgi:catalase